MRHESIAIYTFDELPTEAAKERAREWWRNSTASDFAWADESRDSIKTFCAAFGVRLKEWSVEPYATPRYSTDAENHHFRGRKLRDFDRDAMPTGYCLDCALWGTFYDVFKATGDAKAAFDAALHAGFIDWRDDMESQREDDYIDDALTANGYEFTEDGSIH